jgi:hypothetical protein
VSATLPRARKAFLVTRRLYDEVLVYDLEHHQASCLNQTAALVWRHCDGRTTVSSLLPKLRAQMDAEVDESAVWLALERLHQAHLLEAEPPAPTAEEGTSRRDHLRELGRLGVRAALIPAVMTILAPTVADAQSIITNNECKNRPPNACGNTPCVGGTTTCQYVGKGANTCWCV